MRKVFVLLIMLMMAPYLAFGLTPYVMKDASPVRLWWEGGKDNLDTGNSYTPPTGKSYVLMSVCISATDSVKFQVGASKTSIANALIIAETFSEASRPCSIPNNGVPIWVTKSGETITVLNESATKARIIFYGFVIND